VGREESGGSGEWRGKKGGGRGGGLVSWRGDGWGGEVRRGRAKGGGGGGGGEVKWEGGFGALSNLEIKESAECYKGNHT